MESEKINKEKDTTELKATLVISQKAGAEEDGSDRLSVFIVFDPSAKELGLTREDPLPPSYQLMGEVYVFLMDYINKRQEEGSAEVTETWGLEDNPHKLN